MTAATGPDRSTPWLVAAIVLAIGVVATTAIGMVRWYSPVPYHDMWDGGVEFYARARSGDLAAWWEPHNEHRVVLTRVLLWLDDAWWQGIDVAPRVVDALSLVFAAWVLWRMAATLRPPVRRGAIDAAFGLFLVAWIASWMQKENLTSGFQSCFVLAFVVPLAAIDQLARSFAYRSTARSTARFVGAVTLGIAAVGTMVNGILVLPLMTLQAVVGGTTRLRCLVLGALSLATAGAYLLGGGFASIASAAPLRGGPVLFVQYLLYYLGAPFHFLLKQGLTGRVGAIVAGLGLLIAWVAAIDRKRRSAAPHPTRVALLVFIGYVIASGAVTAWGRMRFGADQAFVGRYTTPALLGWAATFVLVYAHPARSRRALRFAIVGVVVTSLLMIRLQGEALRSSPEASLFDRDVAALALALQVDDGPVIRAVYPDVPRVLGIASWAGDQRLSVFGTFPLRDMRDAIGRTAPGEALPSEAPPSCGVIEKTTGIDDRRYLRLEGRLGGSLHIPGRLRVIDATGRTVGFALASSATSIAASTGPRAISAHAVRGYVLADFTAPLRMAGEGPACVVAAGR